MFWIRDVLGRIQIPDSFHRITYPDQDPDPALFCGCQDVNKKQVVFFLQGLILVTYGTVDTITSVVKNNKSLRRHKTVERKVFLILFRVNRRIRIPEAQKLADPTDPDHWKLVRYRYLLRQIPDAPFTIWCIFNLGEVSTFDGVLLLLPHQLPDTSTVVKARTETGLCVHRNINTMNQNLWVAARYCGTVRYPS